MARTKRECPREAALKTLSRGSTKFSVLRAVMKHVIYTINMNNSVRADVDRLAEEGLGLIQNKQMLPFESDAEMLRMKYMLRRWYDYEISHFTSPQKSVIRSRRFRSEFNFAGRQQSLTVHWLVERENTYEAIIFKNTAPEYSPRGRSVTTRPSGSPELLMIQRCGEAEVKRLGLPKKPVYGAIYYMKSRQDTQLLMCPTFEERSADNICVYCFTPGEAAEVEKNYQDVAPDLSKTCDKKDCADCLYHDLCHLEFEKRHLMDRAEIPLKTIDEITLTDAQQAFISFTSGECRVNAVAGSGKTTIVTLRTLGLLENGVDPESILMVTFSEKAKEEMAIRLKSFAQGSMLKDLGLEVDKVGVETFNSWGQHMLDQYFSLLGFTQKPTLVDEIVKRDIIIDLLSNHRKLPLDYKNPFMDTRAASGAVVKLSRWINAMKAAHVETDADVMGAVGHEAVPVAAELLSIYQEYNAKLVSINAIDYEDQLRLLLKLADFGIFEQLPYKHIVVDEFQDSNPNQIAIIVEVKRRNKNVESLVVVGDELQAIYGFRSATPDNLIKFSDYFPKMVDLDMTANFRSQQPIIHLANKIIRQTARLGKVIEAHKTSSSVKPAVREITDAEMEMDLFTRQVVKFIHNGIAPSSIAIIARTRAELIKQQMKLDAAGVPTILKVPEIVAEAPYVKAIIGLASFIHDPKDLVSLAVYAKSLGQDPFDKELLKKSGEAIMEAFGKCQSEIDKLDTFLDFLKDASEDYVAGTFLEKLKTYNFHSFKQYIDYCVKYKLYGVRDTQSTSREETDCVTLITAHSSKGLEWDNVLLSLKTFPIDEETKRLFYVGVTRAKERLLVTYTPKQAILADIIK